MTTPQASKTTRMLTVLLRDFGYRVVPDGSRVLLMHRDFSGYRTVEIRRSILDAVESLIPILRNEEFSEQYQRIMKG